DAVARQCREQQTTLPPIKGEWKPHAIPSPIPVIVCRYEISSTVKPIHNCHFPGGTRVPSQVSEGRIICRTRCHAIPERPVEAVMLPPRRLSPGAPAEPSPA